MRWMLCRDCKIEAVEVVVGHDQVRLVGTADQLHRNRVHVLLDVGSRHRSAAIGDTRVGNRLPERPHSTVDAAVGSRGRAIRHSSARPSRFLPALPVPSPYRSPLMRLASWASATSIRPSSKVDDRFLAAVLDHLQARDGHRSRVLLDAELGRRNRAVLSHVQHFVAAVGVRVVGGSSVYMISCKITLPPENVLTFPRSFKRRKQRVVVRHVISEFTATALNVSRNDVADT
jgi:hypothetical protein